MGKNSGESEGPSVFIVFPQQPPYRSATAVFVGGCQINRPKDAAASHPTAQTTIPAFSGWPGSKTMHSPHPSARNPAVFFLLDAGVLSLIG